VVARAASNYAARYARALCRDARRRIGSRPGRCL